MGQNGLVKLKLAMPLNVCIGITDCYGSNDRRRWQSELMTLLLCSSAYSTLIAYFVFNIRVIKDPVMDQNFQSNDIFMIFQNHDRLRNDLFFLMIAG